MIENEDSVVTSLNELRKLKNERITRQTQSRPTSGASRAVALAEDPLADQLTPPPVQGISALAAHVPGLDQKPAFDSAMGQFAAAPALDRMPVVQAPPVIQTKTSYKAAVFMTLLLGGAGVAGYMKLQQDTQALIQAKDAAIKSAEEARMRSVETAAKTEQISKANLRQCEDKLKASLAAAAAPAPATAAAVAPVAPVVEKKPEKATVASKANLRQCEDKLKASLAAAAAPAPATAAAVAPVAPVVEKKPEKATVASKATKGSHHSARPSRQTAQAAPAVREKETKEKGADVPTIAKKKKVDNDPLAGLGKL